MIAEWDVVLVIISLIGLFAVVAKPLAKTVKATDGTDWYHVDSEYGDGYITAKPKYTKLVKE